MIEDALESKLKTTQHRRTYRKYKKPYRALLRHLAGQPTKEPRIRAIAEAVLAVQASHGLTPYDVQLLSVLVLMDGGILEMPTGEGKTLIAALASCALARQGRNVHIYTPNDYLSCRDAEFTAAIAERMGLTCAAVTDAMSTDTKRAALLQSDIIYSTERGIIFSFINDNANLSPSEDILPTELDFLIVDEADSILIDNGETPYILSGSGDMINERIIELMPFATLLDVKVLDHKNYNTHQEFNNSTLHAVGDAHTRMVHVTERGYQALEKYLLEKGVIRESHELYRGENVEYLNALLVCLVAINTYIRDVHYVVRQGKVQVVDEHTGRVLPNVRMNGNVHQGLEAKEGLEVRPDSLTKGKITLEAFVSRYRTLSGMTGTAMEVSSELEEFFGVRVYCIPSNKETRRVEKMDRFFPSKKAKYRAMVKDIKAIHGTGQPILVGAASVDEAELISAKLNEEGIQHVLLTPKYAEQEANIISQAGRPGRITVTTNMAGRGTDICLGINPDKFIQDKHTPVEASAVTHIARTLREEAVSVGGLHVIGTERSRSPRVDRQLMGRSGRQGDPGSAQFYVSPEDAIFEAMSNNRDNLKALFSEGDNPMIHRMFRMAITKIQNDIKNHSFNVKKQERKRFGVHELQMKHYYEFRSDIKYSNDESFFAWLHDVLRAGIHQIVLSHVDHSSFDLHKLRMGEEDLFHFVNYVMYLNVPQARIVGKPYEEACHAIHEQFMDRLVTYQSSAYSDEVAGILRETILEACDEAWIKNIARVEDIYKTIHLRSYAGEKPEIKYQEEAFASYQAMVIDILITVACRVASLLSLLDEENKEIVA